MSEMRTWKIKGTVMVPMEFEVVVEASTPGMACAKAVEMVEDEQGVKYLVPNSEDHASRDNTTVRTCETCKKK